ncbi:SDR family NAD(P)-dependent oxidoreductase [Caballeronia sp. LP003]|uniref:SDR family NAD(P)-dependent oxidoreductase n=1 Tax=Caballeronia sp. LP003 TaxID=3038551 RepID=UPI002858CA44|nr:SDR family NAD(P)-dependent oxidoreductase [Caballeronia sp. LP003]MDR5785264.1 SDR family NAD(P)-dependent oxidoreductase [Caballeronia sp. LP003]
MLPDCIVVVTGGASGIGFEITARIVRSGATAIVWDRDSEALRKCDEVLKGKVVCRRVDVSSAEEVMRAFESLRESGFAPTHLVNNAGVIGRRRKISMIESTDIDHVVNVNFKGVVYCTRYFLDYRRQDKRSSIVNLTSIAARTGGMPGNSLYAASKGAISSFTIASAKELAPTVRVNAIAPGIIDTPIQTDVFASSTNLSSMTDYVPMRRLGAAEEIASAVFWLLSDDASYVTGTVLDVDGGVSTPLWAPAWRTP